jgi:CPA2 family monovalent cation:H+ antiporter-2
VVGALLGRAFGLDWSGGIVFGLALSVASTVVLIRVLTDNDDLETQTGRVAIGWLIVEDLFTVVVLVLLPAAFGPDAGGFGGLVAAVGLALLKVAALVATMFVIGERLIPWILGRVAITRSRELFTLTVLVLALDIAVGAARLFGISMPLGAFVAGLVVGRSEFSFRAAIEALPMRDAFTVLFFVSTGILFRPRVMIESPGFVAAALFVILIARPAATFAVTLGFHYPLRTAIGVAVSTAQIGEFSFLLGASAMSLGIFDHRANDALVAAGIIAIILNPLLYRLVEPLNRLLSPIVGHRAISTGPGPTEPDDDESKDGRTRSRAVVVGYGPVGKTLVRLLRENDVRPVVVELNHQTVRRLAADGIATVYGDAAHRETLVEAGVNKSAALFLSSAGGHGIEETIRLARELNPEIQIIARTSYIREVEELRRIGADVVFSSEGELAMAMTEFLMSRLGASGEQIDRQRQRLHAELAGGSQIVHGLRSNTRPFPGETDRRTTES